MATELHLLLVEWDGQLPPSKWYARVNKLTGKNRSVRGDSDYTKSAGERRAKDKRGKDAHAVVEQEGAIVFESRSARNFLYTFLMEEIAPEMERTLDPFGRPGRRPKATRYSIIPEESDITPEMSRMAKRVNGAMSALGRPPAAELHTVCCDECRTTYQTVASRITHCELCSGVYIRYVKGVQQHIRVQNWKAADIADLWLATRVGNQLEPNYRFDFDQSPSDGVVSREVNPSDETKFQNGYEQGVWLNVRPFAQSTNVLPDKMQALRLIDAVYAVEAYSGGFDGTGHEQIQTARAYAIAKVWIEAASRGVKVYDPPSYHIGAPDLFTAALLLNHDELAQVYLTYFNSPTSEASNE